MSKWGLALSAAKTYSNTLNWYKIGLVAALFAAYTGGVHMNATHRAELKCEEQKTELANATAAATVEEMRKRAPVINRSDRETAKLRAELEKTKEKLDDAINAKEHNPSCDLSDAEYDGFQLLADKTRSPR